MNRSEKKWACEFPRNIIPARTEGFKNIEQYISKDNPEAAKRFCDKLLTAAESLNSFPPRGNRANFKQARTLVCKPYIIFYDIEPPIREVQILRFWHAARDQRRLRLKEETAAAYSVSSNVVPAIAHCAS